jgi:DNA-binding GntR family transcriptional regulator
MASGLVNEAVFSSLRDQLLTGKIAAGSKLSQSRLAEQFGVSRIPVRDAVQMLVAEGLVEIVDGSPHATGLSILELQELYEMRAAVEPYLTQIAASDAGRAETIQMTTYFDKMAETTDVTEWLAANAAFHATLYHRANRPRTIAHIDQLRKLTDRYLYLHLAVIGNVEHLQEEHRAILEAAKAKDGALLRDLTRAHLETSHEFIVRYLLSSEDSGAARGDS